MPSPTFSERYGPWALVTGASSGIGRALAPGLAHRGLKLALVARRADRLEELAAELRETAECLPIALDLTRDDATAVLRSQLAGHEVGLLVNNAGFGYHGAFLDQQPADVVQMARLNAEVPAQLAREFLPAMVARGRGGMILVSSTAGFQPTPWMGLYGATKTFDLHLGEALAVELQGSGVDVLTLCPGHTESEFHARAGVDGPVAGRAASAEAVAEGALRALGRRRVRVHGFSNWLTTQAHRLLPRSLVAAATGRVLGGRRKRD